jgi:hypothetical protein
VCAMQSPHIRRACRRQGTVCSCAKSLNESTSICPVLSLRNKRTSDEISWSEMGVSQDAYRLRQ